MELSPKTSLKRESPSLYGALIRLFNQADLDVVESAYREVAPFGGREDPRIQRPEGASFNPRAARICQILMGECGERGLSVYLTGILSCRLESGEGPVDLQGRSYGQELQWAERLRSASPDGVFQPDFLERVFLSRLLDEARHAHMMVNPTTAQSIVAANVRVAVINCNAAENGRLKTLLSAWLERQSDSR